MWKNLCYNPYRNIVQENELGIRRVQIPGGWLDENNVKSVLICRATNSEDLEMASNAMSDPIIARSFNYNSFTCFNIWTTAKNKLTINPENLSEYFKNNKVAQLFKMKVENGIGKRAILTWYMGYGWHKKIIKWDYAMKYISPTSIRAAQVGLYNHIKNYKDKKWIEFGLMNSTDSAVWKIKPNLRKIWSKNLDNSPVAPISYKTESWLTPPNINKSSFKSSIIKSNTQIEVKDNTWNNSNDVARIMWCTKRTLSAYGDQKVNDWWKWFAYGDNQGVILFDEIKSKEQQDLVNELVKQKKSFQRWGVFDGENCLFVVFWIGFYEETITAKKISFNEWVGDSPEMRIDENLTLADDFGRVPYRALSKSGEAVGVAPKRLEQSIHEALIELKKEKGNIDTWIAKLLKIKKADLGLSLSAEQIDAIALSISSFEKNEGLILADETGFGKGRILASLALIGLKLGKTVLFFTEKAQLFSDFYRDLLDVNGPDLKLKPTLLHGKAKVLDPEGNLITKSLSPKNQEILLNTPDWNKNEDKIIMSTYSQINRENKKGSNKKVKWLIDRIKTGDCWLLLDEAHNGAGDSNIAANLNSLLKYTNGVLYSSATYAKSEANLTLYKKAMAVDKWAEKLIISSLENDNGSLREALTTSMAKKGHFIRREHPPVPPPQPIWIDMTPELEESFESFCVMWQMIFRATEGWEKAAGNFGAIAWAKLGSLLSRSIREFSFLAKLDSLIDRIEQDINNNEKVVITLESTFESALKKVLGQLDDEDEMEEEVVDKEEEESTKKSSAEIVVDHIPLWKERWDIILNELAPIEELKEMGVSDEAIQDVEALIEDARQSIKKLPKWDLMPIEKMKRELLKRNIEMGELSGRMLTCELVNNQWIIKPRKAENRVDLVRRFNNGEFSVSVISLAGASGISLHAGKKFKDQRKRNLYEGDIAVNPSNRVQFWGRVRRKDQVCEPFFGSMALNTPGEKRIQAKENQKREKLAAHVGMKQINKELSWISPEGENIVAEWTIDSPTYAKRIGVMNVMQGEPTGRVDRALVRSIILPKGEQEALLSRLERGLRLAEDVAYHEGNGVFEKESKIVRRNWLWGHPDATKELSQGGELSIPRIDYVERVFEKDIKPNESEVINKYKMIKSFKNYKELEGEYVFNKWMSIWKEESNMGVPYNEEYRKIIFTWLKKILKGCEIGKAIRVTRPGTGQAAWGIFLGLDIPKDEARFNGATAWSLTQVAMNVWLVGEQEPILITLDRCYKDPYLSLPGTNANISWFSADTVSYTGISIEGNPLISALWAKGWNIGNPMLIKDEDKGFEWVWMLPGSWNWDKMQVLAKDLINVEQAVDFLCKHQNAELSASQPSNVIFNMKLLKGIVSFEVDLVTYKAASDSWITFKSKQVMKQTRYTNKNGRQIVTFNVDQRSIFYFLSVLEGFGIKWRIPSSYHEWYKDSSRKIIEKMLIDGKSVEAGTSSKKVYNRKK